MVMGMDAPWENEVKEVQEAKEVKERQEKRQATSLLDSLTISFASSTS
jgi:hypothetical protein